MSRPSPVGALRVLLRLSLRRRLNRMSSGQVGLVAQMQALGSQPRKPTARKDTSLSQVLLVLLAPCAFGMSFVVSSVVLGGLGRHYDAHTWRISASTPDRLDSIQRSAQRTGRPEVAATRMRRAVEEDEYVRSLPADERRQLVDHVVQRALAHEPLDARVRSDTVFPVPGDWPEPARRAPLVQLLASLFSLLAGALVLMALASRGDLARLSATEAWLAGFPVSARILLAARLLERVLLSLAAWFLVLPCTLALLAYAGWGLLTIPMALLATTAFMVMVGAVVIACETWLSLHLAPNVLKNVQAVLTVLAVLPSMMAYGIGMWIDNAPRWLLHAPALPVWASPFGLVARLARGPSLESPLLLPAAAVLMAGVALLAVGRMLRGGLATGAGPYQGARRVKTPSRTGLRLGILRKDVLLLWRDKTFMVRTLVLPLVTLFARAFFFGWLAFQAGLTFDRAAAVCFIVAAYVGLEPGLNTLTSEGGALWLLFTAPRPLAQVFLGKSVLWAFVALAYTSVGLLAAAWLVPSAPLPAMAASAMALAGAALFAFGAQAVGLLSYEPTDAHGARLKLAPFLLSFFIAGYAQAIWLGTGKLRLAHLLLSTLTVLAVWQRVDEKLPYLLDPVESPPAAVGALDGLLAAFACLTLQAALSSMLLFGGAEAPVALSIGFLVSGAAVLSLSMWSYRRRGVNVADRLGLRLNGSLSAVPWGLAAGLVAFGVAAAYLWTVQRSPWLAPLFEAPAAPPEGITLLAVMAVAAAPVVEEYVFRGLLYGGLCRAVPAGWAALASAGLFAVIHPAGAVVPVFVLGLLAALVYRRTRVLWSAVATHAVYNLLVVATS